MEYVGVRDLRQNASELLRRVEAGEVLTVTVSGRPVAELRPIGGRAWRRYEEVADLLSGLGSPDLQDDLGAFDHSFRDPFADAESPS